ncbi:transcription initiation factor TFIID subunit D5 [Eremomyces bilateralis CBS 781.70]|uniref:TBP-associated factor 6 n=1 Tax=Eremomyces bilateralis CBS 781.70 TaxID=1392243 RepID=A0A6G1G7W1_9PEZI|nr:transcription initiation factor TFIID subunit D5 [Eremomyces bilateralis CBS 781.70]KAF1813939.1 transcription initiation factor TFIID subunit D5 [Eremomyces bilateralis CBS 781.70]
MSIWNPDNIRDVAESVGVSNLPKDVVDNLTRDVEYRIGQVLLEAMRVMRHSKRTTMTTQDISNALRVLDVEPLYGYESTRPLRFGEASIGPGQPLFYIEDEEVDLEKLINAPLPKVPRDVSFTAHWLAVEGVQPSIPQNPSTADGRHQELLPKGQANPTLATLSGADNLSFRPPVKHILSKELQLYFERVCTAILDENNDEFRDAALVSLKTDPGLHQLVPYFINFVAEKVTHNLKDLFVLRQMMHLTSALLENPHLSLDSYVQALVVPVLTCLVGKHLGNPSADPTPLAHLELRDLACSLLTQIAKKYSKSSQQLKPRLARSCLKKFLDPHKPLGTHYGAIVGLQGLTGPDGVRALIIPNLKLYDSVLKESLADDAKKSEAEAVIRVILKGLMLVEDDMPDLSRPYSPHANARTYLGDKLGEVIGNKAVDLGRPKLVKALTETDLPF